MPKINRQIWLGCGITLAGSISYVLMGVLSKSAGKYLLPNQIMLLQSIIGLLAASIFLWAKKYEWKQVWKKHQPMYVGRIVMSLISIYALIYGLQFVSIFNALIILNSAPLIIPLLRRLFFKKKIPYIVFPSVLLAFAGLILILAPDRNILESAILIIVVSMFCMSFSLLLLEKVQSTDPNLSIFYYFLYSSLVMLIFVIYSGELINISITSLPWGIVIGILFFIVQLSVLYAARFISSQLIAILFYSEILMTMAASILVEERQFSLSLLLGAFLVIVGGVGVVLVENSPTKSPSN